MTLGTLDVGDGSKKRSQNVWAWEKAFGNPDSGNTRSEVTKTMALFAITFITIQ
jgi:hypothetical protein